MRTGIVSPGDASCWLGCARVSLCPRDGWEGSSAFAIPHTTNLSGRRKGSSCSIERLSKEPQESNSSSRRKTHHSKSYVSNMYNLDLSINFCGRVLCGVQAYCLCRTSTRLPITLYLSKKHFVVAGGVSTRAVFVDVSHASFIQLF